MSPKFGTSGLRGLVTELTPALVADHVRAFLAACDPGPAVHIGWDLRPSSPAIADVVLRTLSQEGVPAVVAAAVPTPALALSANGAGAIMVTGSHIPADRNGLKFYTPSGEITKADEAAIVAALGRAPGQASAPCSFDPGAGERWAMRYVRAFGDRALAGLRLGLYQHSSVARDLIGTALEAMGAEVVRLGRSEIFIPVDTEAVDAVTRAQLAEWCRAHRLDALVSTDGDGDRPMVADHTGAVVPGDVLGPLTARLLGAERVVTPVSSNTLVEEMSAFEVTRTRIGSPHVIAGMAADDDRVAGYEANGGFLLGFDAEGPAGPLSTLRTRDCLLPIVAPLVMARQEGRSLAQLVASLPARFTASDRLQGVDPEWSLPLIARLSDQAESRAGFFDRLETGMDLTDGLRLSFGDEVVHLRASGNAPELRVYVEAATATRAGTLVQDATDRLGVVRRDVRTGANGAGTLPSARHRPSN
jgi:phosphomannomutase